MPSGAFPQVLRFLGVRDDRLLKDDDRLLKDDDRLLKDEEEERANRLSPDMFSGMGSGLEDDRRRLRRLRL